MSIQQLNTAWLTKTATHSQKLVLLALADNANDHGHCWPSVTTLAEKCGMSRQGVLNQIEALEDAGLLKTERNHGRSNRYILVMQPVNHVDQSTPLTSLPGRLPPVYAVDYHQSTPLTRPVYAVDSNHQEPSGEPSTNHAARKVTKPNDFDVFWQAYPKKVNKGSAIKAWQKHKPDLQIVLNALEWQKKDRQWTKENGEYIPHPASYLNAQKWLDEAPASSNEISRLVRSSCL